LYRGDLSLVISDRRK